MKIKIGPYKDHYSIYTLFGWLEKLGVPEPFTDKWSKKLENSVLDKFIEMFNRDRKISIKIDKYDIWSMDHTLSIIILPMLKQLKASKHGAPNVDDKDVPENLWSTNGTKENEWSTDSNWFLRWDFVLDEIIWAFEQISSDDTDCAGFWIKEPQFNWDAKSGESKFIEGELDREGYDKHLARINNGLRLFGVYYRGLWD